MFTLLHNYQELICVTNKVRKRKTCLLQEMKLKIFWVVVIIQYFVMSLLNILNLSQRFWEMELHLLCIKVKISIEWRDSHIPALIFFQSKSIETDIMTTHFQNNIFRM